MGLDFRFLDPSADACAGALGELVTGSFSDAHAIERFAEGCDVITYDIESIEPATLELCAGHAPVHPGPSSIAAAHDRLAQKQNLSFVGLDLPPWESVMDGALNDRIARVGTPGVLKLTRGGFDGRGQRVIHDEDSASDARAWLEGRPAIYERLVPFDRELSIIGVRAADGSTAFYPLVENRHVRGILLETVAPAPRASTDLQARAESAAASLMQRIGHVGVMAIELFQVGDQLIPNEFATRVHNTGHWTIDAASTSQFENHLRAILGLPLGDCRARGHSVMLNIYGNMPPARDLLELPGAHVHLYGKSPRPPRKIGHVTLVADSPDALRHARSDAIELLRQYQEAS